MFTTAYDQDTGSWRAYWNGRLWAVASTEELLNEYLRRWKQ